MDSRNGTRGEEVLDGADERESGIVAFHHNRHSGGGERRRVAGGVPGQDEARRRAARLGLVPAGDSCGQKAQGAGTRISRRCGAVHHDVLRGGVAEDQWCSRIREEGEDVGSGDRPVGATTAVHFRRN